MAEWNLVASADVDGLRFHAGSAAVWHRTVIIAGDMHEGGSWDEPTQTLTPHTIINATLFMDLDTYEFERGPDLPALGDFPGLDDGPNWWNWPSKLVVIGDIVYLIGANQWLVIAWLDMTDIGAGWQYTHGDFAWTIRGEDGNPMIPDNNFSAHTDGTYIYVYGQMEESGGASPPWPGSGTSSDYLFVRFNPADQTQVVLSSLEFGQEINPPPVAIFGHPDFDPEQDTDELGIFDNQALIDGQFYALDTSWLFNAQAVKKFLRYGLKSNQWIGPGDGPLPVIDGYDYFWPHESQGGAVWQAGSEWFLTLTGHALDFGNGPPNNDPDADRVTIGWNGKSWRKLEALLPDIDTRPYAPAAIVDEERELLLLVGGHGGLKDTQRLLEDSPGHFIIDPDAGPDGWGREIWALEIEPREVGDPIDDAELANGTPAHVIVAKDGRSAQPVIADWIGYEQSNGGMVAATGRVRQADVEAAPDVLREDATWRTVAKETGELIWQGITKEPGGSAGVVDLAADGVGRYIPAREVDAYLVGSDSYELWRTLQEEPVNLHQPPDEAPKGFTINGGAGSLDIGNYKYAVTFLTAEGESSLGPDVTIPVLIGEEPADIHLRDIPLGGPAVTSRRIYRREPGMGADEFRLLDTLADNTTEVYDDSTVTVAANALALPPINAGAIGTEVKEGALVFTVEKDAAVLDTQRGGFLWPVRGSDVRGFRILVGQNRALDHWELRVATAEDARGPWTHEQTIDLAGEQSKRALEEFVNNGDVDNVRIELRRKTSGKDSAEVEIVVQVRLYGVAPVGDDDFTTSQVVRDVCKRLNVSDALVRATSVPAIPQLFVDTNYGAILDMQALLSNCRWLFLVDGNEVVCDFRPSHARRFLLRDPEVDPDLLPQPRYSRVKLYDDQGRYISEATASPNLLGRIKTKKIRLPFRIPVEIATILAQRLADYLVTRHWAGEIIIPRVYRLSGPPVSHLMVHAGDELYVPKLNGWVMLDEVEHRMEYSTGAVNPGLPLLDRFIARIDQLRESTAS